MEKTALKGCKDGLQLIQAVLNHPEFGIEQSTVATITPLSKAHGSGPRKPITVQKAFPPPSAAVEVIVQPGDNSTCCKFTIVVPGLSSDDLAERLRQFIGKKLISRDMNGAAVVKFPPSSQSSSESTQFQIGAPAQTSEQTKKEDSEEDTPPSNPSDSRPGVEIAKEAILARLRSQNGVGTAVGLPRDQLKLAVQSALGDRYTDAILSNALRTLRNRHQIETLKSGYYRYRVEAEGTGSLTNKGDTGKKRTHLSPSSRRLFQMAVIDYMKNQPKYTATAYAISDHLSRKFREVGSPVHTIMHTLILAGIVRKISQKKYQLLETSSESSEDNDDGKKGILKRIREILTRVFSEADGRQISRKVILDRVETEFDLLRIHPSSVDLVLRRMEKEGQITKCDRGIYVEVREIPSAPPPISPTNVEPQGIQDKSEEISPTGLTTEVVSAKERDIDINVCVDMVAEFLAAAKTETDPELRKKLYETAIAFSKKVTD